MNANFFENQMFQNYKLLEIICNMFLGSFNHKLCKIFVVHVMLLVKCTLSH